MSGTTPNLGLWYPDGSDPISSGDDGLRDLATRLDTCHGTVVPFASAAARDAAIPAPVEGMVCSLADTDTLYRYDGTAWHPVAGTMPNAYQSWTGSQSVAAGISAVKLAPTSSYVGGGAVVGALGELSFPFTGQVMFTGSIRIRAGSNATGVAGGIGPVSGIALRCGGAANIQTAQLVNVAVAAVLNVTAGQQWCPWIDLTANADVTEVWLAGRYLGNQ